MRENDEEEESRRRFLFRALSIVDDNDNDNDNDNDSYRNRIIKEDHNPQRQRIAKVPSNSLSLKNDKRNKRSTSYTKIMRIPQLDTWDCGIACLLMVASWLKDDDGEFDSQWYDSSNSSQNMKERNKFVSSIGTESIWTSDLLLQFQSWRTKRGVAGSVKDFFFVLASQQVIGADESYRDFEYYHTAFEEDQSRVARSFCDLHRQAVPMLQTTFGGGGDGDDDDDGGGDDDYGLCRQGCGRGLALSTLIDIVEQDDCIAVVLLDNKVLLQGATTTADNPSTYPGSPYAGHYVLVCGTSDIPEHIKIANSGGNGRTLNHEHLACSLPEENAGNQDGIERTGGDFCFVLCNPDPSSTVSGSNYMFVTPKRLEASWRSRGTDEDIVFLRKSSKSQNLEKKKMPQRKKSLSTDKSMTDTNSDTDSNGEEVNVLRNGYAQRFVARIQTLLQQNYFTLTQSFWTLYRNHFSAFCRNEVCVTDT